MAGRKTDGAETQAEIEGWSVESRVGEIQLAMKSDGPWAVPA